MDCVGFNDWEGIMKEYIDKQTRQPFLVGGALMLGAFVVPAMAGKKTDWMLSTLTEDDTPGVLKGFILVSLIAGAALIYAAKSQLPAEKRAQIGLGVSVLWFFSYLALFQQIEAMVPVGSAMSMDVLGFNLWFPLLLLAGGIGARLRMFDENSQPAKVFLAVAGAGLLAFMFIPVSAGGESMTRAGACLKVFEHSDVLGKWSTLAMFTAILYLSLIPTAAFLLSGLAAGDRSKSMNSVSRYVLNFQAILWLLVFFVVMSLSDGNVMPFGVAFIGLWLSTMSETLTVGVLSGMGNTAQAGAPADAGDGSGTLPPPPAD